MSVQKDEGQGVRKDCDFGCRLRGEVLVRIGKHIACYTKLASLSNDPQAGELGRREWSYQRFSDPMSQRWRPPSMERTYRASILTPIRSLLHPTKPACASYASEESPRDSGRILDNSVLSRHPMGPPRPPLPQPNLPRDSGDGDVHLRRSSQSVVRLGLR